MSALLSTRAEASDAAVPGRPVPAGARRRRLRVVGLVVLTVLLLTPVFRWNAFGTVGESAFNGWQTDSQALVLGKIESTVPQAPAEGRDSFGMLYAGPDMLAPNATFDRLADGVVPSTQQYTPYMSQIGLPGYVFTALYHLGLTTLSSLQMIESALTVAALLLFAWLLGLITRRSFGILFLVVALGSPWLALAGRNLYWVPWTWFLPACAAIVLIRARGRRRLLGVVLLIAAFTVKWASGYEYLTSVTLLAVAMPVLAAVFRPTGARRIRAAAADALIVLAVAVATFCASVVVLALLIGQGDLAAGMSTVLFDAGKRTYGGVSVDDPVLLASLNANPLDVLATYLFGWQTNVLVLGRGLPVELVLGPRTFWMLVVASVAIVVVRAARRDGRWVRDAWIVGIALAVPLSWVIAAKAHSYVHPFINFVLFYLITVSALIWVAAAALVPIARQAIRRGGVALARSSGLLSRR